MFRATHALTDELEHVPTLTPFDRAAIRMLQVDGRIAYTEMAVGSGPPRSPSAAGWRSCGNAASSTSPRSRIRG